MLIIQQVKGTTPRGRQWETQISYDKEDIMKGETLKQAIIRQGGDNLKQLEYERPQLL